MYRRASEIVCKDKIMFWALCGTTNYGLPLATANAGPVQYAFMQVFYGMKMVGRSRQGFDCVISGPIASTIVIDRDPGTLLPFSCVPWAGANRIFCVLLE